LEDAWFFFHYTSCRFFRLGVCSVWFLRNIFLGRGLEIAPRGNESDGAGEREQGSLGAGKRTKYRGGGGFHISLFGAMNQSRVVSIGVFKSRGSVFRDIEKKNMPPRINIIPEKPQLQRLLPPLERYYIFQMHCWNSAKAFFTHFWIFRISLSLQFLKLKSDTSSATSTWF
jgi:hypothetical protein